MRTHDEDVKDQLCGANNLAPDWPTENLSRVCHAVHMGVAQFKLAKDVSRISCEDPDADDQDAATNPNISCSIEKTIRIPTHGTRPKVAIDEGRDRIPREIDSAIMTGHIN